MLLVTEGCLTCSFLDPHKAIALCSTLFVTPELQKVCRALDRLLKGLLGFLRVLHFDFSKMLLCMVYFGKSYTWSINRWIDKQPPSLSSSQDPP